MDEQKFELEEALVEEYNLLKEKRGKLPEDCEGYDKLSAKIMDLLKELQKYNQTNSNYWIEIGKMEKEENQHKEMMDLETKKLREHTQCERDRNEAMINLEKEKQHYNWQKILLEIGKIVGPPILGFVTYGILQKRSFDFESDHTYTSPASRNLNNQISKLLKF